MFYASRKYLLRSLYHDLQGIYPDSGRISTNETEEVELEVLPTTAVPSGSPRTSPSSSRKRAFHSAISRTLFSISLSESCVLFILLMCQGLDIFHPRFVHSILSAPSTISKEPSTELVISTGTCHCTSCSPSSCYLFHSRTVSS